MNNDPISRSALLEAMPKNDEIFSFEVRRVICNAPAVDAEVVRHGRWYQKRMSVPKGKGQTYLVWACSLCHKHEKKRSDYCPNCGARMDGGAEV